MWTRDDMIDAAIKAQDDYLAHNQNARICMQVVVDAVASMAFDNAATVAERHGDPQIENAINDLKESFN